MNYVVQFDSLDTLNSSVRTQSDAWVKELDKVKTRVQTLIDSPNMSGDAANNIKTYFGNVHMMIIGLLGQLISLHMANCQIYKSEYQSDVDTHLHAVIRSDEVQDYHERLTSRRNRAVEIDGELYAAVQALRDIVMISFTDITETKGEYDSVLNHLENLDEQISSLENKHYNNDFVNTTQMINSLRAFILEQTNQSRDYKSNFSVDSLASSKTFSDLYDAYVSVSKECQDKADDLQEAIENENDRVAALQEEYEKERAEREKKAKVFKWIVTGVCIVGAVAATVATAGAASGLAAVAVAGAISATSSAVNAAANNLADQYVEYGYDYSQYDWGSLAKDTAVAGVTGFITGAVGAGMGGAITSGIGNTAAGSALLHSNSALVRIGTSAVIGSVSEVSCGIVSRGASTLITTGDPKEALAQAFSKENIAMDAATGAAGGAVDNIVSTKIAQKRADEAAFKYNETHNPLKDAENAGITGVKKTANNGLDFGETDVILRTDAGDAIEIKIKATGDRNNDYLRAEELLKEQGIDIDFKKLRKQKNGYVWHHMDDYNAATGETTMQFITKDAHKKVRNHAGSAMQYHKVHGKGYGKTEFKVKEHYQPSHAINTIAGGIKDTIQSNAAMGYDGAAAVFQKLTLDGGQSLSEQMSSIFSKRMGSIGV